MLQRPHLDALSSVSGLSQAQESSQSSSLVHSPAPSLPNPPLTAVRHQSSRTPTAHASVRPFPSPPLQISLTLRTEETLQRCWLSRFIFHVYPGAHPPIDLAAIEQATSEPAPPPPDYSQKTSTAIQVEEETISESLLELIGDVRHHLAELVDSDGGYGTSPTVDRVVRQCMGTLSRFEFRRGELTLVVEEQKFSLKHRELVWSDVDLKRFICASSPFSPPSSEN